MEKSNLQENDLAKESEKWEDLLNKEIGRISSSL